MWGGKGRVGFSFKKMKTRIQLISLIIVSVSLSLSRVLAQSIPPPPPPPTEVKVEKEVDILPEFNGGMPKLGEYLGQNIKYPKSAVDNKIEGTVYLKFIVGKDGSIMNFSIVKGVSKELDKEALRVVKTMPKWIPAQKNGKKVSTEFVLPIKFSLS
jgi:TonB family protein